MRDEDPSAGPRHRQGAHAARGRAHRVARRRRQGTACRHRPSQTSIPPSASFRRAARRDGGRGAAARRGGVGFGFTAVYVVAGHNTQLLGLSLGLSLALLAAALIVAGKFVVPQETAVEDRGPLLVEEEAEEVTELIESGGEGISRRVLLAGAGGIAGAAMLTAAATPLASLGPDLKQIHTTPWQRGVRLIDDEGSPTRPIRS